MAKNREGSVNIYGSMQAKTADGIVAHADGIAVAYDENGKTTKTLAQAIEDGSLGGGSSGSNDFITVESLPLATIGTEVPSSGLVEKVYVNTSLTDEEIIDIMNSLNYTDVNTGTIQFPQLYVVLTDSTMNKAITISNYMKNIIFISDMSTNAMTTLWSAENGWENKVDELDINVENMLSAFSSQLGLYIENDKLKNLISITPFNEPNPDIELDKIYRVPINKTELVGTAVPSSGYIDKIYFNTRLSEKEVNEILSGLEYTEGIYTYPALALAINNDMSQGFIIYYYINEQGNKAYIIGAENDEKGAQLVYRSDPDYVVGEQQGWLMSECDMNIYNLLSEIAPIVGIPIQNEKLKNLFSITPFVGGYDYYQFKNGNWKKFGSGDSSESPKKYVRFVLSTVEEINDFALAVQQKMTDSIWEKMNNNQNVDFVFEININQGGFKYYVVQNYVKIGTQENLVAFGTIDTQTGVGKVVSITKTDNEEHKYEVSFSDPIPLVGVQINEQSSKIDFSVITYGGNSTTTTINKASEVTQNSSNLVTSGAVYDFVKNYIENYMATNNQEE